MDCNDIKEYLYEYATERLDDPFRQEIDDHLKTCADCKQALQELHIDLALLKHADPPQVDSDFKNTVMRQLNNYVEKAVFYSTHEVGAPSYGAKVLTSPTSKKKVFRYVLQGAVAAGFVFALLVVLKPKTLQDELSVVRGGADTQAKTECQKAIDLYSRGSSNTDQKEKEKLFIEALTYECENKQVLTAIHNDLGNCYELKGELEEAIKEYELSIEIDPFFVTPYLGLGDVCKKKGLYGEAVKFYKKAIILLEGGKGKELLYKEEIEQLEKEIEELKEKPHE